MIPMKVALLFLAYSFMTSCSIAELKEYDFPFKGRHIMMFTFFGWLIVPVFFVNLSVEKCYLWLQKVW